MRAISSDATGNGMPLAAVWSGERARRLHAAIDRALTPPDADPVTQRKRAISLGLGLVLVVAMTVAVVLAPVDYRAIGDYGYLGLFLLGFVATATIIVPVPYVGLILVAGTFLDPLGVAVAGAAGTALGELTGYLLGRSGRGMIPAAEWYQRVERAMARFGTLVTFVAMAVPNPLAKAVVVIAGATELAVWKLLLACFAGRALRFWAIAALGTVLPLT
jgi:membrane protein YqaA with SNARE-associated domain